MPAVLAWPAGGRLPARQHGCNRCKEVAPMKTRREVLRLPVDVPAAGLSGTALNQFEQTIARPDIPAAVGLDNNGRARPAHAGIDDAKKDGARRKPCSIGRQTDTPMPWDCQPAHQRTGRQWMCPAPSGAEPPSSDPNTDRATQSP